MSEDNPYASPASSDAAPQPELQLEAADQKKIVAIVKDAGQFWLAIFVCLVCSGIGGLIIPIWYLVRLLQWSKFAKKYPALVNSNAPTGSLPAKFRSAQWKLIVGLVFGCLIFLLLLAYVGLLVLVGGFA